MLKKILFIFSLLLFVMAYATQTRALVRVDDSLYNDITIDKIKSFGDYYALLIYVDDYTNLKRLQTPQKDVEEIAGLLKSRYGFVETKIVANPSNADALIRELAEFRNKLQDDDNLLIYYAGHGSKDGFWQLKDAEKSIRVGWNKHLINIC